MPKNRRLAYLALSINALVWGAAFAIIKPALDIITPTQYLYLRFLVAGACAFPIFIYFYIKKHPKISFLIKVLLLELAGTLVPLLILYEGLARTTALEASLIGATGPIFIVLAGTWLLHERETKSEWQGLALSALGSLMIVGEPLFSGTHETNLTATGNFLILLYNLLNTLYVVTAKKVYRKSPPLYIGSATYLLTATIYGLILASQNSLPPLSLLATNSAVSLAVFYMAVPGTILAFMFYQFAASKIEVSEANLFTYLNGVVAIPVAYLLLGEKPTLLNVLAIVLIAYGVIQAEFRRH